MPRYFTSSGLKLLDWLILYFMWIPYGIREYKFVWWVLGLMTKMPDMLIYGKKPFEYILFRAVSRRPWNLICRIGDSGQTIYVEIMILGWPWPILNQGLIVSLWHLYSKKANVDLNNHLMKFYKYLRSLSFTALALGPSDSEILKSSLKPHANKRGVDISSLIMASG